ncbi:MAG: phasin family protein [Yoonia sp.]|nr:phasin family protein [Yoonia sp.]
MTKETQSGKSNSETSKTSGFDPTEMFQSFMSKFAEASDSDSNPAAGWMELNQHWMNFLGDRFKQDTALLQKLSKCTDPAEMTAAHTEFYKETVEDYQREFAEMTKLGQQAIGQLSKTAKSAAEKMQAKKG